MRPVMELVQRAAAGRCGILICGERGSGREMIARAIHAHGRTAIAPFVKVDCSAPEPEDVELELFGVLVKRAGSAARSAAASSASAAQPSARSGRRHAVSRKRRRAAGARAGAAACACCATGKCSSKRRASAIALDVRVIASADVSIGTALEEGRLRPDLYERLSLIRIDVPALRQRREDIPVLATHFLKELCQANGTPIKTLTRPALTLLAALPWRGNVPELKGLLERLILLVPQGLIRLEDVLAHTQLEGSVSPIRVDATLRQARARFERDYIAAVLQHQHGRIAEPPVCSGSSARICIARCGGST